MRQPREVKNAKERIRYHNKKYGTNFGFAQFQEMGISPEEMRFERLHREYNYAKYNRTKTFDTAVLDALLNRLDEYRDYRTNESIDYVLNAIYSAMHNYGEDAAAYAYNKYVSINNDLVYEDFYDKYGNVSSKADYFVHLFLSYVEEYIALFVNYGEDEEEEVMAELEFLREQYNISDDFDEDDFLDI